MAGLLLAASALAAPAVAPTGEICRSPLAQDDAGSGTDAGTGPEAAPALPTERRYGGTLGTPTASGVDVEDWYAATWEGEGEWTVMVEAHLPDPGGFYLTDGQASPPVELAAYAPDAEEPTHVATMDQDGTVVLEFDTQKPGTWHFQVRLTEDASTEPCLAVSSGFQATSDDYRLYWGCHPHCVEMR